MDKLDEFGELLHTLNVWERATERLNACDEGAPWRYRQELRSDERKARDGYMALLSVNAPAIIALARQSAEQAARVVALEAENARLRLAVDMAANTFERYERLHREKGTHDGEQKAYSNGQLAYEMRAALGAA